MAKDIFNINDILFNILVNLMYGILKGIPPIVAPTLGIPSGVLVQYLDLLTIWNDIFKITENRHGATFTNNVAKNDAKLNLTNFLRPFVKKSYQSKAVQD